MQLEPRDLKRWMERMEKRMAALERAVRKIPIETGGGGGTVIRYAKPDKSLWRGTESIGDIYSARKLASDPQFEDETISCEAYGFVCKGGLYPVIKGNEGKYIIIGGGIWLARVNLQENLPQGGSANANLAIEEGVGDTIEVFDNWGGAAAGDVALASDAIGVAWEQEGTRWEVWVNNCHDELVEEVEE